MNNQFIVLLITLIICQTCADYQEDVWQEPNAWERHSPSLGLSHHICPVCDVGDESALAVFYYRKLIANLFNKKALREDEYTGQLERAVIFSLSPAQMATIEQIGATNIRDLDEMVTNILSTTRIPADMGYLLLVGDIWKSFTNTVYSHSEARFVLLVIGFIMLVWFIHKRYNKNIIAIVATGFLLFGYAVTYLECNRKMEVESIVNFARQNAPPEQEGWLRHTFNSLFKKSKQEEDIAKINEGAKIKLPFCRPDHVLMMYFNEMLLNQLQLIIEKCSEMIITFRDLPFPYNIGAMIALPFLFMGIVKLIFKYLLNPVILFRTIRDSRTTQHPQLPPGDSSADRLTGENLRMVLAAFEKNNPPSGVEEIIEVPQSAALKDMLTDSTSVNNNSTYIENVKSKKES